MLGSHSPKLNDDNGLGHRNRLKIILPQRELTKKNRYTPKMKEREVVVSLARPPHCNSPKPLQPSEQALHLPSSSVTSHVSSVLLSRFRTSLSAFGSDEPDAAFVSEPLSEWLTVKRPVADEDWRDVFCYCLVEDVIDETDIMSRAFFDCDRDGHPLSIGYRHDLR